MEAVILAGGKGTRLKPYTTEIPKPLVSVGERPIIEILLARMKKCGVTKVYLAVNHLAHLIEAVLGDGGRLGLPLVYSHESTALSTVGPLKLIAGLPDYFIVANGDILTDLDFRELYRHHLSNKAKLTVATCARSNRVDYGVIEVDQAGIVTGFKEKPTYDLTVSAGVYVFSKEVLEMAPDGIPFGFDDLMFTLLKQQEQVSTFPFDGYWLDVGRPDDYEQAQRDAKRIRTLLP
ncbi:MAG: NTP transferase domain-containing protein [candidate division Zixibacteria bacterium]|nr:NTP transferase domain-containing protein [candidate division Zixibacteria bacterium]